MAFLGTLRTSYQAERATPRPRKARTPLLVRVGRTAARLAPRWQTVRTLTLSAGSFAAIDAGLWQLPAPYSRIFGLVGIGAALLIIEALAEGE